MLLPQQLRLREVALQVECAIFAAFPLNSIVAVSAAAHEQKLVLNIFSILQV